MLQQVDNCVIHIRWATSAACPEEQTAELDKCRVFDNSTGEYYSLKPLANFTDTFKYYQVVRLVIYQTNGDCVTAVQDNSLGGGLGKYMAISVLNWPVSRLLTVRLFCFGPLRVCER